MAQITIYVDDTTAAMIRTVVKRTGVSQSQWIAEAIQLRAGREWPASVQALGGAWRDFPEAEEIRKTKGRDTPRERL